MDSGIISYIRAFGVRWFVAMSGPLSVPLAVITYFVQNDTAKIILFTTTLLCAIFATYWVWKSELEARIKVEAALDNRETRKNIRIALSTFHQEGQALRARCELDIHDPPSVDDSNLWAKTIENYIQEWLDESWIVLFRDDSNIPAISPLPPPPENHYRLWMWIHIHLLHLGEFITNYQHDRNHLRLHFLRLFGISKNVPMQELVNKYDLAIVETGGFKVEESDAHSTVNRHVESSSKQQRPESLHRHAVREAEEIIRAAGMPVALKELYDAIAKKGVNLGGQKPQNTLSAYLSGSENVESIRKG